MPVANDEAADDRAGAAPAHPNKPTVCQDLDKAGAAVEILIPVAMRLPEGAEKVSVRDEVTIRPGAADSTTPCRSARRRAAGELCVASAELSCIGGMHCAPSTASDRARARAPLLAPGAPASYSLGTVGERRTWEKAVHSRSLLSLVLAGTVVAGIALNAEPAYAGRRAFIGGLVGGAVAGALIGGAMAASTPRYYYGGPAYVFPPPPPPVYPMPVPYYPPQFCPRGLYCR